MTENLKLKKVNKSFVPEPRKSSVFRVFSDSDMRMNIMNVLCMWISWSYFWTYILHALHIILHLVRHIPTKWFRDHHHSFNIIYIYIYIYIHLIWVSFSQYFLIVYCLIQECSYSYLSLYLSLFLTLSVLQTHTLLPSIPPLISLYLSSSLAVS